ncbi:Myxococcales GC_trans_RRR domain protein [Anaeromyxobacter dehalogenans 2CP-1]|uniref:Myxococcales GC_trans_RRR domain protein n=1 Tax=Anaeromyxobacter dehalogenans (strain ATCC BAA-258 / DSM 21875 / 2CP-1) TaxID=455488 RepID=B8J5C8_ANAD2|nr:metallophosphoesterase [Anaeromyxobacter dehalogenans]ACL66790.1 Myxococcales GC_trans_RRR domain protein [Anaeromyxobacter dehalogenans 2CP-1]
MRSFPRLLLALAALPSAAFAASVTRGPFLQQTGPSSALVVVDTDAAATVQAIADLPGGGTARAASDGTHHLLRLDGLPAASAVPYRLTVDGVERPGGTLHTPGRPDTAEGRAAILAVVGDYGTGDPAEMNHIARIREEGAQAILTVGDNAYPDATAADFLTKLFRPMAALLADVTMWPALGDHEYRQAWAQPYLDAFELPEGPQGERYYAFDWGDVHVAALDSNCIVPMDAATAGCDGKTMVGWLTADLAASRAPWKIVLIHRPVVATGKYGVYPQIPAALLGVLEGAGVDLVLQGHNHLYERSWPTRQGQPVQKDYDHPAAPVYVTSGGAGGWLYDFALPAEPWTAYREKIDQHLRLTLEGGTLKVDSIRGDGVIHDTFTIVKDIPPLPAQPPGGGDGGGAGGTPETPPANGAVAVGCQAGAGSGWALLAPLAVVAAAALRRRRQR